MTLAFLWEKSQIYWFFILSVRTCSQLDEFMKLHEYQMWKSFLDLDRRSHTFKIKYFFSETTGLLESKFHMKAYESKKIKKYIQISLVTKLKIINNSKTTAACDHAVGKL